MTGRPWKNWLETIGADLRYLETEVSARIVFGGGKVKNYWASELMRVSEISSLSSSVHSTILSDCLSLSVCLLLFPQNFDGTLCVYIRFIRKNIGRQTVTRIHEQKA